MTTTAVTRAPGLSAVLGSEWRKLWTLRSTFIVLALAIVLSIGVSVLVSTVVGANWESIALAERRTIEPLAVSLSGALFSDILLAVLAVTTVSAEYSTGMIRLTLVTTPRRGRVLGAKFAVIAAVALMIGLVVTFGGFWIGRAIFSSYGFDLAGLGNADVLRAVVLSALATPVVPLLAAGFAVLWRSAAGAIAGILGLLFAPAVIGGLLPEWWQENVLRYLPGALGESLAAVTPRPDAVGALEPFAAGAGLAGWVAVAVVASYALLARRDA